MVELSVGGLLRPARIVEAGGERSVIDRRRRLLQLALGAVWLLDAALQYQPFMFGRAFATQVIAPTAQGNPALVARSVLWAAQVMAAHPVLWNALFATVQLLLGLGLLWRRTVKLALAASVVWSLAVWWLGEGFGGVLAGTASPIMGAPGAVVLYALLALLAWPSERGGESLAAASVLRGGAAAAWVVLWASEAYFALLPGNDSAAALHGMLAGMADGEPAWLASLDRWTAGLAAHQGATLGLVLGVLLALAALAAVVPLLLARPLLALALLLAVAIWVLGQDFGGIFTGQGTDPNSGLLLALLALAYWPSASRLRTAIDGETRRRPVLMAAAILAAALASGGAAVAAATSASSSGQARPAVTAGRAEVGPGPVAAAYRLGAYRLVFRDSPNRASKPGLIAVQLSEHGRPVAGARVKVTLASLGMDMGTLSAVLPQTGLGRYALAGPILGMSGRWRIGIAITPRGGGQTLHLSLIDQLAQ